MTQNVYNSFGRANAISQLDSYRQKRQSPEPNYSYENNTNYIPGSGNPTKVTVTCEFLVQVGYQAYVEKFFGSEYVEIEPPGKDKTGQKDEKYYKIKAKYEAYSKSNAKNAVAHLILIVLNLQGPKSFEEHKKIYDLRPEFKIVEEQDRYCWHFRKIQDRLDGKLLYLRPSRCLVMASKYQRW